MAVTTFHDFPLAPRDRAWDGAAAEKRVRSWADAEAEPNPRYRDAHIWYDAGAKQNFTAYKLLFTDIVNGRQVAVPRAIMAAGNPAGTAARGASPRRAGRPGGSRR
jgi:hypothetical protein